MKAILVTCVLTTIPGRAGCGVTFQSVLGTELSSCPSTRQNAANVSLRGDSKQIATCLKTLDFYSDNRLRLVSFTADATARNL